LLYNKTFENSHLLYMDNLSPALHGQSLTCFTWTISHLLYMDNLSILIQTKPSIGVKDDPEPVDVDKVECWIQPGLLEIARARILLSYWNGYGLYNPRLALDLRWWRRRRCTSVPQWDDIATDCTCYVSSKMNNNVRCLQSNIEHGQYM